MQLEDLLLLEEPQKKCPFHAVLPWSFSSGMTIHCMCSAQCTYFFLTPFWKAIHNLQWGSEAQQKKEELQQCSDVARAAEAKESEKAAERQRLPLLCTVSFLFLFMRTVSWFAPLVSWEMLVMDFLLQNTFTTDFVSERTEQKM